MKDNILVTGGCGYIGKYIVNSLLEKYNVFVIDNLSNSYNTFTGDNPTVILHDLCNPYEGVLPDIYCVIHLAGLKSVPESVQYPKKYMDINISTMITALNIASKTNCKRFIFSSTAAVYKPTSSGVYTESSEINPTSPYGMSKYVCECLGRSICSNLGINFVSLRYFNPYGGVDNSKGMSTNLFPIIKSCLLNEKVLQVHLMSDNTNGCIRDFIKMKDLVKAHTYFIDNWYVGEVNIGTGNGVDVLDIAKYVNRKFGLKYIKSEKRIGDNDIVIADNALSLSLGITYSKFSLTEDDILDISPLLYLVDTRNDDLSKLYINGYLNYSNIPNVTREITEIIVSIDTADYMVEGNLSHDSIKNIRSIKSIINKNIMLFKYMLLGTKYV